MKDIYRIYCNKKSTGLLRGTLILGFLMLKCQRGNAEIILQLYVMTEANLFMMMHHTYKIKFCNTIKIYIMGTFNKLKGQRIVIAEHTSMIWDLLFE